MRTILFVVPAEMKIAWSFWLIATASPSSRPALPVTAIAGPVAAVEMAATLDILLTSPAAPEKVSVLLTSTPVSPLIVMPGAAKVAPG